MVSTTTEPEDCLVIFTRYPEPGKVKTRLIPALGPEGAARLHRRMAERIIAQARRLNALTSMSIEVWFTGGGIRQMEAWLGEGLIYQTQPEGDLGDRMASAFTSAFSKGYRAVAMIGTDCPDLSTEILQKSFSILERQPLVLGPAKDGGYYLIGLQHFIPALFTDIPWSTERVLARTIEIAQNLQIPFHQLMGLNDIDRPQDLACDVVQKLLSES